MARNKVIISPTGQLQFIPTNIVIAFKAGVASQANLPLTGNAIGDARLANDTGHLYVWSIEASTGLLTDWSDAGDIVDLNWSAISGKPSSAVADIDSAVSLRHAQNTDNTLKDATEIKFKRTAGIDPTEDCIEEFLKINTTTRQQIRLTLPTYFGYSSLGAVYATKKMYWNKEGIVASKTGMTVTSTVGTFDFGDRESIIIWENGDIDCITGFIDEHNVTTMFSSEEISQTLKTRDIPIGMFHTWAGFNIGIGTGNPTCPLHIAGNDSDSLLFVGSSAASGGSATICLGGSCGSLGYIQLPCHNGACFEDDAMGGLIFGLNAKRGSWEYPWDIENGGFPGNTGQYPSALVISYHSNSCPTVDITEGRGLSYFAANQYDRQLRPVFQITTKGKIGINNPEPHCRIHLQDWDGWLAAYNPIGTPALYQDFEISGIYTLAVEKTYIFEITENGTPDKFKWSDDGGATWTTDVPMTDNTFITISNGIKIRFSSSTGAHHIVGDRWSCVIAPNYGQLKLEEGVIKLTKNGVGTVQLGRRLDALELVRDAFPGVSLDNDGTRSRLVSLYSGTTWQEMWYEASTHKFMLSSDDETPSVEINSQSIDSTLEFKMKVYEQDAEPVLTADERMAMWVDTNDSNKTYLLLRRKDYGSGFNRQVKVELT